MAQIKTKQIKDTQAFTNITPVSTGLNDILTAIDTRLGLTGGVPRINRFATPSAAAQNADTAIVTLTSIPLTTSSPTQIFVNGAAQFVGSGKDVTVVTATGVVTWRGGTAPGTGTAEFAIETDDLIEVSYESVS